MIKSFIKAAKEGYLVYRTIKQQKYYDNIEDLPIYNFFKIRKGEYQYLWKDPKDYNKKYSKTFFSNVFYEMYFQFPKLDNTYLRDIATLEDYRSKHIRTGLVRWKNEYNTLEAKIKNAEYKETTLDDFTNHIERTFGNPVGSLDVYRVSTSKAFSNYHLANEKIKKSYVDNKR